MNTFADTYQSSALDSSDMSAILDIMLHVLGPSQSQPRSSYTLSDIYNTTLNIVIDSIRRRGDLVFANVADLVTVICAIFPLLQRPRKSFDQSKVYRARVTMRWPFWMSDADVGLGESEARLAGRLLENLSRARLPPAKTSQVVSQKQTIVGALAKHVPSILLAYVRAASDPVASLSTEVRHQLEPGLFALCDLITSRGRAAGRERAGEDTGLPFGLGEGVGREVEKEVWADMWRSWSRRRYTGQG